MTTAAVLDVSDHTATETSVEATRTPSPSSNSTSHTTQRSCSELLYDYMRTAIRTVVNLQPDLIPMSDIYHIDHLDQQTTREPLSPGYELLLRVFVRYTWPKDDLYYLVRASATTDDMAFLRGLKLTAKSAANPIWMTFFQHLLLCTAEDGN